MAVKYFKPDIAINTCCDHCGTQRRETLERLYSEDKLYCTVCGQEHSADRTAFRQSVEETEALIDNMPPWTAKLSHWLYGR